MRAAAILGLGCSAKDLKTFQTDGNRPVANQTVANRTGTEHPEKIEWRIGVPGVSEEADVILLFGGDGTIHRHLGQLVELAVPVLIVPAGSGNDFARALGLKRVHDSLVAWRKFRSGCQNVREIDLGVVFEKNCADEASAPHGYYFSCVAGVGLDSEVSRRANQLPRWLRGHGGYALSMLPSIFSFAPVQMKISSGDAAGCQSRERGGDDWIIRSDHPTLLAAFANTPYYGGGMKIAPQAKMDDGLLDVCVIGGVDPFRLFCMFPTVYYGQHLRVAEVNYFQASRARIESERPLDVYADGEYVCQTPVEIEVRPTALKVVTP